MQIPQSLKITPADGAPQSASGDIKNDTTAKSAGKKPAASKKKVILDPFDEEAIAKAEQEQLAARETDKGQAGSKPKAAGEDDGNDIIEKFIDQGEHKVVAKETTPEYIPGDNSGLPVDDDLITEELAEIYLDQELFGPAIAIYERLSLIYPKKSIDFAEIIESAKARAAEEKKK